jgi:hypothetical protein
MTLSPIGILFFQWPGYVDCFSSTLQKMVKDSGNGKLRSIFYIHSKTLRQIINEQSVTLTVTVTATWNMKHGFRSRAFTSATHPERKWTTRQSASGLRPGGQSHESQVATVTQWPMRSMRSMRGSVRAASDTKIGHGHWVTASVTDYLFGQRLDTGRASDGHWRHGKTRDVKTCTVTVTVTEYLF